MDIILFLLVYSDASMNLIRNNVNVRKSGFEPVTFCTQNKRATKLRYIPLHWFFWFLVYDDGDKDFRKVAYTLFNRILSMSKEVETEVE